MADEKPEVYVEEGLARLWFSHPDLPARPLTWRVSLGDVVSQIEETLRSLGEYIDLRGMTIEIKESRMERRADDRVVAGVAGDLRGVRRADLPLRVRPAEVGDREEVR